MNVIKVTSNLLFPLITFPYLSRVLGPDGTGKNAFAFALIGYFILIASIGIPVYGIREVARIRDNKVALSALVQELLILHALATIISFLGFLGLMFLNHKVQQESLLFLVVSFSIPLSLLTVDWLYQGLEDYAFIAIRSLVFSGISIGFLFLFVHQKGDYVINAAITILAALGSSIMNFWHARKIIFKPRVQPWTFRRHLRPLGIMYTLNFLVSVYVNIDTVMLGFLSTAQSVGYYSGAMKLTKMLLGVVTSFGTVLIPRLSYYLAIGQKLEFERMIDRSIGFVLLLCLPITVALMVIGKEIVMVMMGAQYLPSIACLSITAPIIILIGLTNIFAFQILYPLGLERKVVLSVTLGAIVAGLLNWVLIPKWGHVGAAWAALFAEFVVFLVLLPQIQSANSIRWPWRNLVKYVIASGFMLIPIFLMRWITRESQMAIRLALDVPLGVTIYFGVLLLIREELSQLAFSWIRKWTILFNYNKLFKTLFSRN